MDVADPLLSPDDAPSPSGGGEPSDAGDPVGQLSVLALIIARNPGEWFPTVLTSLARQSYARLAVRIVDVASDESLSGVVARHCPRATLRRLDRDPGGFGATVNAALADAPRAALYLICHDDVALADDTVTELVTEVVRSNAAVVGPKFVDWDEPDRLLHVGLLVDRFGAPIGVVDTGELDQEQHDAVTDVFAVPGGCVLVRADLFRTIGGYDEGITFRGDDVDLCWRAQLAGARVMVVPAAVVRHREQLSERDRSETYYLRLRHALRSAWSCYSVASLVRIVPVALALSAFEFVYSLVTGRFSHARAVAKAWLWNIARLRDIRQRRRQIARYRNIDDSEIRALQARGSARVRAFVRGHGGDTDRLVAVTQIGRDYLASLRAPGTRYRVAFLGVVALAVGFGTRHLLTRPLPAIGEFQPLIEEPWFVLRDWWGGWHAAGGGTNTAAPTGQAFIAALGLLFLNHTGALIKLVVLAPLAIGPIGMWRFCRAFGSARASTAGTALYALTPIAYDALAHASWAGLAVFATVPFALRGLARLLEVAPFAVGDPGASGYPRGFDIAALGLVVALAAVATPFVAVVTIVATAALIVGSLLGGDDRGFGRLATGAVGALAVAALLHLPSIGAWLHAPRTWATFAAPGTNRGGPLRFDELLRLSSGPFANGYIGYLYGVPLVLAILVAQNYRLAWAVRAAVLVAAGVFGQWAGERGWLPVALPDPTVVLTLGAFGFALGGALVAAAIEEDLPRYRLGWRQSIPGIAVLSMVVFIGPVGRTAIDGRWGLPSRGIEASVSFLDEPESRADGSFRVVWLGDRAILPLSGATFDHDVRDGVGSAGDLVLALTDSRGPQFTDRWAPPQSLTALSVADELRRAIAGENVRLGQALAPYAVRYVIVVEHRAPTLRDERNGQPAPAELVAALRTQFDLERVEGINDAVQVYRNAAWVPVRSVVAAGPAGAVAQPILERQDGSTAWEGEINAAGELRFSYPYDDDFRLTVNDESRPLVAAGDFGIKAPPLVSSDLPADVRFSHTTPISRRLLLVAQVIVWVALIATLLVWRDRLRRASEEL